jgi:hypothetical protein
MDAVRLTYRDKLLDPRWQRMRLLVFARDGWTCVACGESSGTLHVHHLKYEAGKNPWESEPDALATLCQLCHRLVSPAAMASLLAERDASAEELESAAIRVEEALFEWLERRRTCSNVTSHAPSVTEKYFVSSCPNWRDLRPRAGRVWTPDEDASLLLEYDAGLPLEEIALSRGRGVFGVAVRLYKLGRKLPDQEFS